jgi:hypothetical protein
MTTEQWLLMGSYLLTGIVALLNFGSKVWKSKTGVKIDEGTYVGLLNENIRLATERALKSEKETLEAEKRFEERELKLVKRIDDFEAKLNLALQENQTLKSLMAEMQIKQVMSDKKIAEQNLAQQVSQRLIEEQRREIIALQDFSERLIQEIVGSGGTPPEYKPKHQG